MCFVFTGLFVQSDQRCHFVGNCVPFQQLNLGKSHEILLYLSTTTNVQSQLNLIYKNNINTHKNSVFSAAYCPFFSGIKAVVLILLLGACESKKFPTAEYNKSQNYKALYTGFLFYQVLFTLSLSGTYLLWKQTENITKHSEVKLSRDWQTMDRENWAICW